MHVMLWHSTSELNCIQNSSSVVGGKHPPKASTHALDSGCRTQMGVAAQPSGGSVGWVSVHDASSSVSLGFEAPPHATIKNNAKLTANVFGGEWSTPRMTKHASCQRGSRPRRSAGFRSSGATLCGDLFKVASNCGVFPKCQSVPRAHRSVPLCRDAAYTLAATRSGARSWLPRRAARNRAALSLRAQYPREAEEAQREYGEREQCHRDVEGAQAAAASRRGGGGSLR